MARMSSESDKIKQLLLADELALLQQLRERILESDRFSEEVAQVLAKATGQAWKNDPSYQAVLAKPIGEGLKTALKREQRTIIDAFVPVIGPMIRASVSASIQSLALALASLENRRAFCGTGVSEHGGIPGSARFSYRQGQRPAD